MPVAHRVLDTGAVSTLDDYLELGGGRGLDAARRMGPAAVLDDVEAAGVRGRGGAGFPTARKWRAVVEHGAESRATTVVVNGAEGEPGSFKDRALLRANPYRVLEGALIAAAALDAGRVVVGLKASFTPELERLHRAIAEITAAGWPGDVPIAVVAGPGEYLCGEETALLEVIDGRAPFPRIAPPFRRGVDEVAPTLVNNVETLAHVACVLAEGPGWFREVGTDASPGTVVCTVSGDTRRHGVAEVAMGTPLREVIERVGGRPPRRRRVAAVMTGVSSALIPASRLDTPLTYEDMEAIGTGLGTAGFIVFDDRTDVAAVARGVSRFLAVESCGQCTPCKQDGLALAELFSRVVEDGASDADLGEIADRMRTVADEARCFLAAQHQRVAASIVEQFGAQLRAPRAGRRGVAPVIAPIADLDGDRFVLETGELAKQPDWTFNDLDSGQAPADRIDQRAASG
jgi:NADH:ubiquinone oxidoreductase subunit F (NADH-binding)